MADPPATAWAEDAQLNGRPPRDCVGGGVSGGLFRFRPTPV